MVFLYYLLLAFVGCRYSLFHFIKPGNGLKLQMKRNMIMSVNNQASEFLEELELKSWGSFSKTSLKLQPRPSFSVITGKSGTGKSVLIGAFEYLIKQGRDSKSNGKGSRELFTVSGGDTASISIKRNGKIFERVFSIGSKKSTCEIDGKRVPVKQFTKKLPIRFWYKDSLKYLDSGSDGVITYIHDLASIEESLLLSLASSHSDWYAKLQAIREHEEFENLSEVKKMELNMLRHFVDEVDKVRGRIIDVLQDVNQNIAFLLYEDGTDSQARKQVDALLNATENNNSKLNLKSLHNYLESLLSDGQPNGGLWRAVNLCTTTLTQLADASAALFTVKPSVSTPSLGSNTPVSFGSKLGANGALTRGIPAASPGSKQGTGNIPLGGIEDELEKYLTTIDHFNATCDAMGVMAGSSAVAQLDTIRASLENALTELAKSREIIGSLRSEWSEFNRDLEELSSLRSEWEALARKHSCPASELEKKYGEWQSKLILSDSIHTTLPQLRREEAELRNNYCQLAAQLTLHRLKAASRLADFVNSVLPPLEMADKRVSFKHSFTSGIMSAATDVRSESEVTAEALSKKLSSLADPHSCSERGWDDFELQIHSTRVSSGIDSVVLPVDTLSTGEKSRLALALETGYLQGIGEASASSLESVGSPGSSLQSDDSKSSDNDSDSDIDSEAEEEPLLVVFDELDAHVGGEAAAAVARLLKQQGRHRQVIAVTHSPIVAAAADRHFLVSRMSDSVDAINFSSDSVDADLYSTVTELEGVEREKELSRMATGSCDNQRGQELARELLSLYSQESGDILPSSLQAIVSDLLPIQ